MPNWCSNRVRVYSDEEDIKRFKKEVHGVEHWMGIMPNPHKDSVFSFNSIIPLPDTDDWRDWCIENWGTKWDTEDASLDVDEVDNLEYSFETAWCPPEGIFLALKSRYPHMDISWFYDEPGMQFAGYWKSKGIGNE